MSAVAALAAASAAGVEIWLDGQRLRWRAARPNPEVLDQLRAHKSEVLDVLAGSRCHGCGCRLAWPAPVGIVHGNGRASCWDCYYAACAKRALAGVVAVSDAGDLLREGGEP